MTPADLSLTLFALCNALRLGAFLPQMLALVRDPRAAHAFSYATWLMFAAANASTAFYAGIVLSDGLLACVHAASTACCSTLVGLAWWRRRRPCAGGLRSALG